MILRCPLLRRLTMLRAAVMLSVRRAMSALRYLALMARNELVRPAAQAHR
jgi:hypothetical protein